MIDHDDMARSDPDHDDKDHDRQQQQRKRQRSRKQRQQKSLKSSSRAKHAADSIITQPSAIPNTHKQKPAPVSSNTLANEKECGGARSNIVISRTIDWLDKRKKRVPDALLQLASSLSSPSSSSSSLFINIDSVMHLLPSLRERERRALVRHLEKCVKEEKEKDECNKSTNYKNNDSEHGDDPTADKEKRSRSQGIVVAGEEQHVLSPEWGSDGEYYDTPDYHARPDSTVAGISIGDHTAGDNGSSNIGTNNSWPLDVEFSNNYRWDARVPDEVKDKYSPRPSSSISLSQFTFASSKGKATSSSSKTSTTIPTGGVRRRSSHPSKKVYYRKIHDPNHPAYGEYGLYCALPDGAPPGTWLLDYIGHISLGEHQDQTSDYVSDFGLHGELSVDAATYGNESRFLNDYRNTGKHANCEFKLRWDARGELRQGVYVKRAKESRDPKFRGVGKDEELLVSYGRSYWRSRVGNLTDFVWRLPGTSLPMSEERISSQMGHSTITK